MDRINSKCNHIFGIDHIYDQDGLEGKATTYFVFRQLVFCLRKSYLGLLFFANGRNLTTYVAGRSKKAVWTIKSLYRLTVASSINSSPYTIHVFRLEFAVENFEQLNRVKVSSLKKH